MRDEEIKQAVQTLSEGGLVAFPTETVYGLGADAANEAAIRKIFAAKERPYDHPLIVHLASVEWLAEWAREIPVAALTLAQAFWPGPLTMIFKKKPQVLDVVTGGQDTVGVRIPRHRVALSLLQHFGRGVAAPSANKFTHISPTTADGVREELGERVDVVLDGGACEVGLESTILDLSQTTPTILRPGMISREVIARLLGVEILLQRQDGVATRAPGMHHLHYAPITKTVLIESAALLPTLASLQPGDLPAGLLLCAPHPELNSDLIDLIEMPRDAITYAHDLYAMLRKLDQRGYKQIMIEAVPNGAEWEGIRDRLGKACR